jgi:hypoxia up-regulated 1
LLSASLLGHQPPAVVTSVAMRAAPAADGGSAAGSAVNASSDAVAGGDNATAAPAAPKYVAARRTLRFTLSVVDDSASVLSVGSLSAADKAASRELLARLDRADDERRTREAAKNSVEAYVYATREKLSAAEDEETESSDADTLVDVTTAEQREALKEALSDAGDWLYGDGEATDTETYRARLRALKDLGEPPFARLEELRARGRMIKDAKTFITASRATVEGWAESHPQITANETADATAAIDEFDAWFTPKLAAQQALVGHE